MRRNRKLNQYHVGDARDLTKILGGGREFIDVTVTSPPYWNVKDYGKDRQIGFGQSYDGYLADLEAVFHAVFNATKPTGSLWVIADTLKHNGEVLLLPFDIARRLSNSGWILQDIIIWQKDRTLPWSHQGKLRNIFEYIACYSKRAGFKHHVNSVRDIATLKEYWVRFPERYNPMGKAPSRTWHIAIPRQGSWGLSANYVRHYCPLPTPLIERVLRLTTDKGDTVFDPFAGSGAVLAAAASMGRKYLGIDLNPEYRRMFQRTVLPAVKSRYTSNGEMPSITDRDRKRFGKAIIALRQLKYPRELFRLYRDNYGDLKCRGLWVARAKRGEQTLVVFEFPSPSAVPADFDANVATLCGVRPLSKYELVVRVRAVANGAELRRLLETSGITGTTRVCTYHAGRFYSWETRQQCSVILRTNRAPPQPGKYPPIFSPLRMRIDPAHPERLFDDKGETQARKETTS